jgi:hypothetical protein
MSINHEAPCDYGWLKEAIADLDARLTDVESKSKPDASEQPQQPPVK